MDEAQNQELAKQQVLGVGSFSTENPSLTKRLLTQQAQLRSQLAKIDAALEALESNPEVARIVNAISKIAPMY